MTCSALAFLFGDSLNQERPRRQFIQDDIEPVVQEVGRRAVDRLTLAPAHCVIREIDDETEGNWCALRPLPNFTVD